MSHPAPPFAIRALADTGTTLEQLRAAVSDAPPEANLVFLQLQNAATRFPPICPNCEQPATSVLPIQRAFLFRVLHDADTPNETVPSIDQFDVPFCDACLHQLRSQRIPPSPWTPLRRILSDAHGPAGLVVMAIAFMFFHAALTNLSLFPLLLGSFPLGIGFWLLWPTWKRSRHMSLPKPAQVDLAVDFTPVLALRFEPPWLAFQFRSPHYAALFRQLNVLQLWNPKSSHAQSASAQRRRQSFKSNLIVGAVLAAALLWGLWQDYLSEYVMPYFDR